MLSRAFRPIRMSIFAIHLWIILKCDINLLLTERKGRTCRISSKILHCASYFQLFSRCLDIPIKLCLSCLIYYIKYEKNYDAQRSIFDEIRGVWIADETLSRVFDISSQSRQKLRCKKRSKIVKVYANLDQVSKPPSRL